MGNAVNRIGRPHGSSTAAHDYFTYNDLADLFGCSVATIKRKMPEWRRQNFPHPLPWSLRQARWHGPSVQAWKERQEVAAAARALHIVSDGRAA